MITYFGRPGVPITLSPNPRPPLLFLLVKSGVFFLFYLSRRAGFFVVFVDPFPEEEISDYQAHCSIIQVLKVADKNLRS